MKKQKQPVLLLLKALLVISVGGSCKTEYSKQEMFFIYGFHEYDTVIYQNMGNVHQRDTIYFKKQIAKKNWLPGFRDGIKYSDEISINYTINQQSNDANDNALIFLARSEQGVFVEIYFEGFFSRFDKAAYCCLYDTTIATGNGKYFKPPIYRINYKMGADTILPTGAMHHPVKYLLWKEEMGMILFEKSDGTRWVRIN